MSSTHLRVLHVIGPLEAGGAQTQLLGLVRAAHPRLWNATVVGTSGGALAEQFRTLGCPFVELRRRGSPGLLRMRAVRRLARQGNFDVIHGNLWQSNLYSRLAVLGWRNRAAVVISERNIEESRSTVKRWLDAQLAGVTEAYVGNTNAVCQFIRGVHPITEQEVITLANAVDSTIFFPAMPRSGVTHETRVGSIGRLDREKGFDVLIDAMKMLVESGDYRLEIAGIGPLEQELKQLAASLPVRFKGALQPGYEVAAFLNGLDVFVLPSRFREGRPNVLLEAIATDTPIVTTALEGMEEIVAPEVLVRPNDPIALADGIRQAATDPEGWKEASRPAPVENFGQLAEGYRKVFERAIALRARRASMNSSRRRRFRGVTTSRGPRT